MTLYIFPPAPDFNGASSSYAWVDNIFTEEELNKIILLGSALPKEDGSVTFDYKNSNALSIQKDVRKSKHAWMPINETTAFIYSRLVAAINSLNAQFFQFDLYGYTEPLQYTVYEEAGDHYDWHFDKLPYKDAITRKLTSVLMLSDNNDHEGGELQVLTGGDPHTLEKNKGRLFIFPSYLLHRVTPVTSGRRITLVSWVSGNKFK